MKEQEEVKRADDEEEDITKIVIEDLKVEEFNDQEEQRLKNDDLSVK